MFALSLGPIVWMYNAEVLPDAAISIATAVNWGGNIIQFFPKTMDFILNCNRTIIANFNRLDWKLPDLFFLFVYLLYSHFIYN